MKNAGSISLALSTTALMLISLTPGTFAKDSSLKQFDCANAKNVISKKLVKVDKKVTKDGNGSIKVTAKKPVTVRIFEVKDLDIDNARLLYKAKVKTKDLKGKAYLEMWCHFPDKGEFFSRGLAQPLSGTNDWSTQEIPFLLKEGQKPDLVKLNLVIKGTGTAWIDNIELNKGTL